MKVSGKGSPCVHALMNTCLSGLEAFMDTVYLLHYFGTHQWGYVAGRWAPEIFLSPALGLKMCAIITNRFTWILGLWLWSSRLEDKHFTYQMGYLHSLLFCNMFSPYLSLYSEVANGGKLERLGSSISILPRSHYVTWKVTEECQPENSQCPWPKADSAPQWLCVIEKVSLFIFIIRRLIQYIFHWGCLMSKQCTWKVLI